MFEQCSGGEKNKQTHHSSVFQLFSLNNDGVSVLVLYFCMLFSLNNDGDLDAMYWVGGNGMAGVIGAR